MDNLSTISSTDITNQIGALELGGDWEHRNDGALEGVAGLAPTHHLCPTVGSICTTAACPYDSDSALEATAANLAPATYPVPYTVCCARIDDGALEAAGAKPEIAPSSQQNSCVPTFPPSCRK